MRMSRLDWLAQFFRPAPRSRLPRPKREKKEKAKPRRWKIDGHYYTAHTKSEARALHKKHLRVKRLTPGTVAIAA